MEKSLEFQVFLDSNLSFTIIVSTLDLANNLHIWKKKYEIPTDYVILI